MKVVKHSSADVYWTLHVEEGGFMVNGHQVPFPFCLGTIDPNGKINVWTPAGGGVPRGYKEAARATLAAEAQKLFPEREK